MPKPETGEIEKDFLKRCIPQIIREEEYEQKQAVAICYSIYRKEGTEKPKPTKPKPTQPTQPIQTPEKLNRTNKTRLFLANY